MIKIEDVVQNMRTEHEIKIPGAVLMFLANILKDRQIALFSAIAEAERRKLSAAKIDDLMSSSEANEIVGGMMLDLIAQVFGDDVMNAYITGELDLPEAPINVKMN